MNEHQNVNKEYKAPQRITWHSLWSQPPQTVPRLNNHKTVHIQSKVIIWSCCKNKRALLIPDLSPLLTWVSPDLLISKYWWTMPMYVEPFLLFITEGSKFMELELTHKPLMWTLNEWILTFVLKWWCGQLISIHTVSWIIIENH